MDSRNAQVAFRLFKRANSDSLFLCKFASMSEKPPSHQPSGGLMGLHSSSRILCALAVPILPCRLFRRRISQWLPLPWSLYPVARGQRLKLG